MRLELAVEDDMLITTGNDLPDHETERVRGEVFGLTVRSRNLGSQMGAGLKSLVGGELRAMTTMLPRAASRRSKGWSRRPHTVAGTRLLPCV